MINEQLYKRKIRLLKKGMNYIIRLEQLNKNHNPRSVLDDIIVIIHNTLRELDIVDSEYKK